MALPLVQDGEGQTVLSSPISSRYWRSLETLEERAFTMPHFWLQLPRIAQLLVRTGSEAGSDNFQASFQTTGALYTYHHNPVIKGSEYRDNNPNCLSLPRLNSASWPAQLHVLSCPHRSFPSCMYPRVPRRCFGVVSITGRWVLGELFSVLCLYSVSLIILNIFQAHAGLLLSTIMGYWIIGFAFSLLASSPMKSDMAGLRKLYIHYCNW
ncbi:hypothetical protein GQ43DRAFT_4076 [Delitschia confertaspora ATCC 74209]|uniref:Uncharacterized protein n=1 Tax=Delitschia confertaspora ATCC 74209 TaxID=1513339 RepID=A0A9P4JYC5_9PLEO|nr:hypothetical protein GQ43DRAFT_4076 [Delitschia confertaspora ATCC 74209]